MQIDHLIYGAPDRLTGIRSIEALLGVRPAPGGKHVGIGTHNALVSLGNGAYLEVISPDPDQPRPEQSLPYGLDDLVEPRLITWAVKAPEIESLAAEALAAGVDLGPVQQMARQRPDGGRLEWRLTRSPRLVGDGLVPFLIAWNPCPHPSETAPPGGRLISLRGEHPEPESIARMLDILGAATTVALGPSPALIATIEIVGRTVELR